jgi:hypothetical protein
VLIADPESFTGLFMWENFVTVEHRYACGLRETTMMTQRQYESARIEPPLTALPGIEQFRRGCWIGKTLG